MKKWKKILALSFGIAALGLLLTACGGEGGTTADTPTEATAGGNEPAATQAPSDTLTDSAPIRIMAPVLAEVAPEDDSVLQQRIEELTGFEMDITWIPNSAYGDRLSLVLAGDDVPEVLIVPGVPNNDPVIVSGVSHGAFWNLDPYIDQFNYLSMMNPGIRMNASFNGDTYGIYRSRDLIRASINIRRDWLDELGLDLPTTLEEFTDMCFAFRDEIEGDTYCLTIPQWGGKNNHGPLDIIAVMFGAPNRTAIVDGEVVFDFMTEEYIEAMEWVRMLVEEGLINSDFVTMPTDDWNNDFMNDRAGAIMDMQSRGMSLSNLMRDRHEAEDGSAWVAMIGNFATPNADAILPTTGFNGGIMIPTASVQTEERLLEVLTFLNYLNSEEIHTIMNLGVEDVHWYWNEDGVFERIVNPDEAVDRQDIATIASFAQIGMGVSGFVLPAPFNEETGTPLELERVAIRDGERYHNIAVFNPTQAFVSETATLRGAILDDIMLDARIQFVAGQIDRAGFEAEVQRWLDSGGYTVIQELTELYHAAQ